MNIDLGDKDLEKITLAENERKFRDLLLHSPAIFLTLKGPKMIIEFANEALLQSLKRNPDIVGKPLFDALPELRNQAFPALLDKVYETGMPYYGSEEKAVIKKDGVDSESWFNYVFQPVIGPDRKVTGITVMAVDITEEVLVRKRVEASEQSYRLLVNSIQDYGMFMFDLDGIITSWNPGIGRILGYNAEEFIGQQFEIIFPIADREKKIPQQELYEAARSGRVESDRWQVKKDQGLFYSESVTTAITDSEGKTSGYANIFRDVTNRMKIEKSLQIVQDESERQKRLYEAITGNTPDLIYVFDLDYKFAYANKALLNMWGKTWDEAVGFDLLHNGYEPWHAEMHEREIDQIIATKQSVRGEVSFPHATLGRRVYDYILVPVINESGIVEAVAGTTRDITEIKRAEATLKESSEKLEALVIERTKALQGSNEDLQQFAHVASHDLKEPVRKVRTFSARLKQEFEDQLPEKAKSYISKIEKAAERMYAMIDGVLSYSSFNSAEMQVEDVDLNSLLENIRTDLEILIQQNAAMISYSKLPVIKGEPVLIYQLFYNLINNSLKFSKQDRPLEINISAIESEDASLLQQLPGNVSSCLKITVRDNGIGFDPADSERIFQSFARLNPKDQYEGTGLGLALCKKIVQKHKGAIYADGKKGEGAEFTILLPVDKKRN